jgi:hypothetical protein
MIWKGDHWGAKDHGQGGHPSARISDGNCKFGSLGPWNGPNVKHQKTGALIFIAPASGIYKIQGTARSKPWTGNAKTFKFGIFKKDAQRAAIIKQLELPRENKPVPFEIEAELATGHEILFIPLMPDWHSATTTMLEGLTVSKMRE